MERRARLVPRSSNGRTAAFGAVNRGSNPRRGAEPNNHKGLQPCLNSLCKYLYSEGVSRTIETLLLYKRHTPDCAVHKSRIPRKEPALLFRLRLSDLHKRAHTQRRSGAPPEHRLLSISSAQSAPQFALDQGKGRRNISGPTVSECIEKYLLSREREIDERHSPAKLALQACLMVLAGARSPVHPRDDG